MLWTSIELNKNIKNIKHAYKLNKNIKNIKHAYKLKFFSPFLSIINKGVKTKQTDLKEILLLLIYKTNENIFFYIQNKESIKGCSPPFCLNSSMIPIKNVSMKCIWIPIKSETIPIEKQKS